MYKFKYYVKSEEGINMVQFENKKENGKFFRQFSQTESLSNNEEGPFYRCIDVEGKE